MRSLFSVLCKLLGLFCIYLGIFKFPFVHLSIAFGLMNNQLPDTGIYFFITILGFLLSTLFGLYLIVKSEYLADLFKLINTEESQFEIPKSDLLQIGLILIGAYVIIEQLPFVLRSLYGFYVDRCG